MYKLDFDDLKEALPKLPAPVGYKVLLAIGRYTDTTAGGIKLPEQYLTLEDTASILGYVVEMGEDAYSDRDKFPTGPYCQEEDWVMFRSYSGVRFKVNEMEFRLINDDQVDAIVENPADIKRV